MLRTGLDRLLRFLAAPITRNIAYFAVFVLLSSALDMYQLLIHPGHLSTNFKYAVYILAYNVLTAYVFTLIIGWCKNRVLRRVVVSVLLLVTVVAFVADAVCWSRYGTRFLGDFPAIILGSNRAEAVEFFSSVVSVKFCATIIVGLLLAWGIFRLLKKVELTYRTWLGVVCLAVLAVCCWLANHNKDVFTQSLPGKYSMLCFVQHYPDLDEYRQHPQLVYSQSELPSHVVVIIGESFSKSHSSLYGYGVETNPQLAALQRDSDLVAFENVTSPAVSTIPAVKCIMSTYRPEMENSAQWYECLTMTEVVQSAGYRVAWVSNQGKLGLYDNIVGKYSEMCDTSLFVGDKFAGTRDRKSWYDEALLPGLGALLGQETEGTPYFYYVHLMGSHESFANRFPSSFARFTPADYQHCPEHQRKNLAAYDNSILYNDYVVSEIIKRFADKDAVVIYFPDHGLDIYESSPDYCSHAVKTNEQSCAIASRIPFVIYTSKSYQQHHSGIQGRIRSSQGRAFRTDDVIYTIMYLLGIRFKDNDAVGQYSLIRE